MPEVTQHLYSVRFLGLQAAQSNIKVNNAITDGLRVTLRLVIAFALIVASTISK